MRAPPTTNTASLPAQTVSGAVGWRRLARAATERVRFTVGRSFARSGATLLQCDGTEVRRFGGGVCVRCAVCVCVYIRERSASVAMKLTRVEHANSRLRAAE